MIALLGFACTARGLPAQDLGAAVSEVTPAAAGQSEPDRDTPDASERDGHGGADGTAAEVRFVGPDTYILLDEQGRPQQFPGMTYEDFMTAWRQLHGVEQANQRQPRFSIEQLQIEGESRGSYAALNISLQIVLLSNEPVTIPLRFPRAILEPPAAGSTPPTINQQLAYDDQTGGLVAWMRGKTGERRVVQLRAMVPLEQEGNETSLRLTCPRAVSSRLILNVPGSVVASVNGEGVVEARPAGEEDTQLSVTGVAGDFELRYRTGRPENRDLASVLRASGSIRANFGRHSVRLDARLAVQSFGSEFDQFLVRLPPGSTFLPNDASEAVQRDLPYSLAVLGPEELPSGVSNSSDGNWVQVRLRKRQRGPVEVALGAELPLQGSAPAARLGGFEVYGAIRQFGDVVLVAADDWQLRWEAGDNVRQVDATDTRSAFLAESALAAFRYDRQPWSLRVGVSPQSSRVHATPKYQLQLLPDEARVRAEFAYFVSGARPVEFRIDLPGWQETTAVSDSARLIDTHTQTKDGKLVLRLNEAAPQSIQVVIEARRELTSSNGTLELPLPVPLADVVGSGELVVLSPPHVSLTPKPSQSVGLTSEVMVSDAAGAHGTPAGFQALTYRTFLAAPIFAVERAIRSREIAADVATNIEFGVETCQVEQLVRYQVHYQPMQRLEFRVPASILEAHAQLKLELILPTEAAAGEQAIPLEFNTLNDAGDSSSSDDYRLVQLTLPQPRLGRFDVRIRFRHIPSGDGQSRRWTEQVPLLVPQDGALGAQEALVTTLPRIAATLADDSRDEGWRVSASQQASDKAVLRVAATDRISRLALQLAQVGPIETPHTTVERVWQQTWIAPKLQQHRAVYLFRTNESQITVELPTGSPIDQVDLLLDGEPIAIEPRESGPLRVPVMSASSDRLHTLEVLFRQPTEQGIIRRRKIAPPLLAGAQSTNQSYLQIVVPADTYVVSHPGDIMPAASWGWLGTRFGDRPTLQQPDLERWTNATQRLAPSPAENEYLYYSLSRLSPVEIMTAPRWLVVLMASSATLAVGLLLTYVRQLRRAEILALLGAGLALATLAFPRQTLLVAQAAGWGLVLTVVALALKRYFAAQAPRRRTATGSTVMVPTPSGYEARSATPLPVAPSVASSASVRTVDLPS